MDEKQQQAIRYSFPSEIDMLAEFGLEGEFDEDVLSLTYVFRSSVDATELILTYSEHRRFVAATMLLDGREIFAIDLDDVVSIRIISERGESWLQAAFASDTRRSDLVIQIEPVLRCRWVTSPH